MSDSLIYTLMDNGIHHLVWKDSQPGTVDAYVRLYQELQPTFAENSVVRVLHDYRDTGRPAFYTIANAMQNTKLRDDITFRIAHLYSDLLFPSIVTNASLVAQFDAIRKFFKQDEEQQAIDWLLNNE